MIILVNKLINLNFKNNFDFFLVITDKLGYNCNNRNNK